MSRSVFIPYSPRFGERLVRFADVRTVELTQSDYPEFLWAAFATSVTGGPYAARWPLCAFTTYEDAREVYNDFVQAWLGTDSIEESYELTWEWDGVS